MVTKCKNGHWYDSNINRTCPHCSRNNEKLSLTLDNVEEDDKTVSIAEVDISLGEQLGQIIESPTGSGISYDRVQAVETDDDRTISFGFFGVVGVQPVTGWLVCLTGEERGKDFRLHSDKNFIGRAATMDIALIDDKSISRERHCSLTYDPKGNDFYLSPEGGNVVYHNGRVVEKAVRIRENDIIKLGETELCFVPYCKEDRQWVKK